MTELAPRFASLVLSQTPPSCVEVDPGSLVVVSLFGLFRNVLQCDIVNSRVFGRLTLLPTELL